MGTISPGTLANGLIAHWGFDNGSLLDSSGNNYTLTKNAKAVATPDKDGTSNNAMLMQDNSGQITASILRSALGAGSAQAISFGFWIKGSDDPTQHMVAALFANNYTNGLQITKYQNKVTLNFSQGIDGGMQTTTLINSATGWHHIVVVAAYDIAPKIYVDGVLETVYGNTAVIGNAIKLGGDAVCFGYSDNSYPYSTSAGILLDEIRLYNRKLTDSEIAELYTMGVNYVANAPATPNEGINRTLATGLLAHWDFTNGRLTDVSGNNYTLTKNEKVIGGVDKDGISNNAILMQEYSGEAYATIPRSTLGTGASQAVSFGFWIKGPQNQAQAMVASLFASNYTNGLQIYSNGGKIIFGFNQAVDQGLITTTTITQETGWHHIVFVGAYDTVPKLYVNGILEHQSASGIGSAINLNGDAIFLGHNNNSYPYDTMVGLELDEIRLYNRKLTDSEIAELYTMGVNYAADTTPPTLNSITASNATTTSITLNVNANEAATVYYRVVENVGTPTTPTPAELKATHDGTISLDANVTAQKVISGLTANKSYRIFVVADDTSGNLQNAVSMLDTTTLTENETITPATPNEGINGTLGNGLLAHWDFSEGRLLDVSGNSRNLEKIGTPVSVADKLGNAGNAMSLLEAGDRLEVPFSISPTNIALSFWVKVTEAPSATEKSIIHVRGSDSTWAGFGVTIYNGWLKLRAYIGGNYINSFFNKQISDGMWHHIVVTHNSVTGFLNGYVDKLMWFAGASYADTIVTYGSYNKITIGGRTATTIESNIYIDEVRVYDKLLSGHTNSEGASATDEIAELFEMGVNYTGDTNPPTLPKLANPTFSPETGFEFSDMLGPEINGSLISGVGYPNIYATIDGTMPDENAPYKSVDPGQLTVWLTQTCTVKAIAMLEGYESSDVVEANYVKLPNSQVPTITPAAGTYSDTTTVTITAPAGPEVTVFYTTNGSTPTYDSPSFTGTKEIEVADNMTIKAFALQSGYSSSEIVTVEIAVNYPAETEENNNESYGSLYIQTIKDKINILNHLYRDLDFEEKTPNVLEKKYSLYTTSFMNEPLFYSFFIYEDFVSLELYDEYDNRINNIFINKKFNCSEISFQPIRGLKYYAKIDGLYTNINFNKKTKIDYSFIKMSNYEVKLNADSINCFFTSIDNNVATGTVQLVYLDGKSEKKIINFYELYNFKNIKKIINCNNVYGIKTINNSCFELNDLIYLDDNSIVFFAEELNDINDFNFDYSEIEIGKKYYLDNGILIENTDGNIELKELLDSDVVYKDNNLFNNKNIPFQNFKIKLSLDKNETFDIEFYKENFKEISIKLEVEN